MKVTGVFSLFGAIILLAALGVVATNPAVVTQGLGQFNSILKTATHQ